MGCPGFPSSRPHQASEYAIRLSREQKVSATNGVFERQFPQYFDWPAAPGGYTAPALMSLLERRLTMSRHPPGLGFAKPAARGPQ